MLHFKPTETHAFLQANPQALFLDIRMELEYLYVGHPPGVVHVAWYEYPEMQADVPHFVSQVKREAGNDLDRPVVLLCRSGARTLSAGEALEKAGFSHVINVLHGFEGDPDENFHRGKINGWRHDGLPWEQM